MKPKDFNFDSITRQDIETVIDEHIVLSRNAERNRKILKRRLIDGLTYEELAEESDLSVQSVQKIIYQNENKIFRYLQII